MPEVAFVEFPPKKSRLAQHPSIPWIVYRRTVLVEQQDVASSQVNGMGSTQSSDYLQIS